MVRIRFIIISAIVVLVLCILGQILWNLYNQRKQFKEATR